MAGSGERTAATSAADLRVSSSKEIGARPRGRWLVFAATGLYCRLTSLVRDLLDISRRFVTAVLAEAVTTEEKSQLTVRIYDGTKGYRRGPLALYPWEETWLGRRLPEPPARVLVGACGAGREAVALVEKGYEVDAFEPARELAAVSRSHLGERARVGVFRYEDLSREVLDSGEPPEGSFARERYDAVLLGSGSFTHVMDAGERSRLVRALDRICPRGPILATFFCAIGPPTEPGRAERWGKILGRRLGRLRGIEALESPRESFADHRGFAYTFTRQEIEDLGAMVRRRVVWEQDDTTAPHVTFLPDHDVS